VVVAILRVHKDVRLLREKGDVAILRVHKDVRLLWEKGKMSVMKVRQNVTLQRGKRGYFYTEGT